MGLAFGFYVTEEEFQLNKRRTQESEKLSDAQKHVMMEYLTLEYETHKNGLPKHKYCDETNHNDSLKIPKDSHHLWIGHNDPKAKTIKVFKDKIKEMNYEAKSEPWKHIFWCDSVDRVIYFENLFKDLKIEVRNIYDSEHHLTSLSAVNHFKTRDKYSWGIAASIDLLKYDIVNQHGGVAMDLNFEFRSDPIKYLHNNDLVLPLALFKIENCMVAATTHHPVLENIISFLKLVAEAQFSFKNEFLHLIDLYKGDPYFPGMGLTKFSYQTLGYFYHKYSNQEGYCDTLLGNYDDKLDGLSETWR